MCRVYVSFWKVLASLVMFMPLHGTISVDKEEETLSGCAATLYMLARTVRRRKQFRSGWECCGSHASPNDGFRESAGLMVFESSLILYPRHGL